MSEDEKARLEADVAAAEADVARLRAENGTLAASFREDLKLEGNLLVLMQNLRNFTVQFELLRKSGVPV